MADAVVIKPHRPWTQRNVNASEGSVPAFAGTSGKSSAVSLD